MLKKSLSLVLSLIMILTCCVALSPLTAEARTCPNCGGSGRSGVCPGCGGTRIVTQIYYQTNPVTGLMEQRTLQMPCSTCNGTGQMYCPTCHGSGVLNDDGSASDSGSGSSSASNGVYDCTPGVVETEDGYCFLDNDNSTKYNIYASKGYICWKAKKLIAVEKYVLTTANDTSVYTGRNPKKWVLYASNKKLPADSDKWVKIHSVKNDKKLKANDFTSYTFKLKKKAKAYQYYKFEILDNKGDTCTQLAGIKLKGTTYTSPKTSIKSAKKKSSTALTVKWEKKSEVKGYIIQYSTSKKFKKAKSVTVKKASAKSKAISGLTKGKKYFVRVRTYKVVNKVKVKSKWSKKKAVQL